MRILFLCGSLAKGRDGVGDYTRLLAEQCAAEGAVVKAISLSDVVSVDAGDDSANELRLSRETSWSERSAHVQRAIARFQPDWISLQFVPYAFDPRGLTLQLTRLLARIRSRAQWHVMFHETWITASRGLSWKRRLTGSLQRVLVQRLLATIRPRVIHTSNARYRALLASGGIACDLLPMFGAIPVANVPADEWLFPLLQRAGAEISSAARERYWLFGFFGSLYPEWDPQPLMRALAETAKTTQRTCCFISIGLLREGQPVWDRFAADHADTHVFLQLGEQPPERVSAIFNSLDFGVSPVPVEIIGKSASAAAMLEHGLPLLVTRLGSHFDPSRLPEWHADGIHPVHADFARELESGIGKRPRASRLPRVAAQFLESLRQSRESARTTDLAVVA